MYAEKEKMYPAYVSKHNSNREKTSYSFGNSKRRKMALSCSKKVSTLLRGITFLLPELPSLKKKQKMMWRCKDII